MKAFFLLSVSLCLALASASNGPGGNITVDAEAKIQVVCMADYIEVSLQMSDYPGLIVNDSVLHLEDEACVAGYKDDSMVKFTFGLEACNTQMEDDGDKIYYKNTLYLKADEKSNDSAITREHTGVIPFQCGYDKKTVISKVSYDPRSTLLITDADGFGNFTYFMDMYEDDSNNETVTEFPKEVGLGQKMYFGFRVQSGDSELVVFPDLCKATASSSFDSTPDHLIIENACSRDNTLDYTYDKKEEHFFNLAAFRFKEGYDDVYIHCKLTVCRKADSGSRCDRGCEASKRRRRSTEEDMSAEVYVGPLKPKLRTNEPAKEQNLESESSSNSMILIVAVLVGVLGTVALGLIIAVVILSRRRSASGKGASLIVAEEM
ncbi:hypothetical protein ACROYT_G027915 [Oculina patagonica]